MFELLGKIAPIFFRNPTLTRGMSTRAPETFAMLASKKIKWKLPSELPPYSSLLYVRKDFTLELGNFPEENLYILRNKGKEIYRFNKLPDKWVVPNPPSTTPENKLR